MAYQRHDVDNNPVLSIDPYQRHDVDNVADTPSAYQRHDVDNDVVLTIDPFVRHDTDNVADVPQPTSSDATDVYGNTYKNFNGDYVAHDVDNTPA